MNFQQKCQQLARDLQQINPEGVNPFVTKRVTLCQDCGEPNDGPFLCRACTADLAARRAQA
jgi:hypothetical protein